MLVLLLVVVDAYFIPTTQRELVSDERLREAGNYLVDQYNKNTTKDGTLDCTGRYKDGSAPSKDALSKILQEHSLWLKDGKQGTRANLCKADLAFADFKNINLHNANLDHANLSNANLSDADLSLADLSFANLHGATLSGANLNKANLTFADLSEALLIGATLREAALQSTKLAGAGIFWSDFHLSLFEPDPTSLPSLINFSSTENLHTLKYVGSAAALLRLREIYKEAGMRTQAREITYAIKRSERVSMGFLEKNLNWLLFDLTSHYGMSPARPLQILLWLIPGFAVVYMFAILYGSGESGIWAICTPEGLDKAIDGANPVQITGMFFFPNVNDHWGFGNYPRVFFGGLYFSLLSAFRIGWRDFNAGNWISRLQTRDYVLRGRGWVRSVSGLQSLISVYLLALFILCYFGSPFDN